MKAKLFRLLFKLVQLVKFVLTLIYTPQEVH